MAESVASAIPAAPSILTITATQDPFLPVPSKDLSPAHALSRPQSNSSRRSDDSRMDVKNGDGGTTGVIIIGLDTNDAATVGRTTASRGSSSVMDPRRPSETNDTERDETEVHNNLESDHNENNIDDKPPLSIKHLTATFPVDHHGRSNSISTPPSSLLTSSKHFLCRLQSPDQHNRSSTPNILGGSPRNTSHNINLSVLPRLSKTTQRHGIPKISRPTSFCRCQSSFPTIRKMRNGNLHPNPHHPKPKQKF